MTLLLDPETPAARELIYRTIVETADEGIWVIDAEGRTTFVNEKMARMLGYTVDELLGIHMADVFFDEESRTLSQVDHEGPGRFGSRDHLDVRYRRKDGSEMWALLRRSSVFGSDGGYEGVLAMITDITERKQGEMLSEALNSINTAMNSLLDADGIMQKVMTAASQALRCETASIMLRERRDWIVRYAQGFDAGVAGLRLTDAQLPHAMLAVKERDVVVVEDALADARIPAPGAEAYRLRSFLILPLIIRNEAIGVAFFNYHSEPQNFTTAQIDFARKLAAALGLALENARLYAAEQRQRAMFQSVVDNAPAGMVVFYGRELRARLANQAYLSFLAPDWQQSGITGRRLEEFSPGIAGSALPERIHRVARTGRPDMEQEWAYHSPTGTTYWRWTLTPLPSDAGVLADVMFQMVDVTEQVHSRQQIEQLLGDLQRAHEQLQQQADELAAQAEALQVQNDQLADFTNQLERRVEDRTASLRLTGEELAQSNAALRDYARRTELLAEVSQALAEAGPDTRAVLDTVARRAVEAVGDVCGIAQLSPDGQHLVPVAVYHPDPEVVEILQRFYTSQAGRADEGLSGQVLRSGQPMLVPAVNQADLLAAAQADVRPFLERHGIYSLLVAPLRARGKSIGTLALGRDTEGRPYTEEEQAFLQALASRAALAIADAELYEQLAKREQQLRYQAHLLEHVTDAIYATDSQFHVTAWNHAAEEMFGLPASETLGRLLSEILVAAFIEPDEQEVAKLMAGTDRYRGTIRYDRRDGTSIISETTGVVLRDEAGAIAGYIGVNRDITEQRQAQEALRHNEALLRKVLDTMPVGVWVADRDGRTITGNRAAQRIWGGIPFAGPEHPALDQGRQSAADKAVEPHQWGMARAVRGETIIGEEIEIEALDGTPKVILTSAVPLLDADGHITGGLVINEDITESKQAERALRIQAERLHFMHDIDRAVLAAQSPAAISQSVVERIRRLVPCEQAVVLLFDFERQEALRIAIDATEPTGDKLGQRLTLDEYGVTNIPGADRVRVVDDLRGLSEHPPLLQTLCDEGLRSFVAIPLMAKGQLIGHLDLMSSRPFTFTDVDVEIARQVGDSLAVALQNAQLFVQIERERQQQQALARSLVEVQESERRTIARELHDEASQALTSLIVGIGLLQREAAQPQAVIERAEELKAILNSVMEGLHRLSSNLRPASLDRMGLVAALRQHIISFEQQSGLEVSLATLGLGEGETDDTVGDVRRLAPDAEIALYRIVQEALTNVARHAQARHVGVVLERRGDRAVAVIEDDGVGFDLKEALARGRLGVFGMSERAEMLGGQLHVESAPGKGTTILVEVPCGEP